MAKHIDPIYKQYAARIIKYIASTEFYDYFMMMLENGKNTMQFSNRRVEKIVDKTWVVAIETAMKPMEEIINNPRKFIIQEEIIVNVALAKTVTPETVQHLAQHGAMVDRYDEEEGVRPNRLMEKSKEDSWNTYENRFVYTLLEMTYEFVNKRYEAIFGAMNQEEGAFLRMTSDVNSYHESLNVNVDIRLKQVEDLLSSDERNESIFARIARLHRLLTTFRSSRFAKEVAKYGKIKPPLVRTNAIAKNPNFKACHKLWNFIMAYRDIGYTINVYDQNPEISDSFMMDIFHSIMFDYIILKNYLENPEEREFIVDKKTKRKQIKPRFLTEIIEEVVDDYDLPDVEVRKVLIEELTKADLMKEEAAERRRLVEEKERELRLRRQEEAKERARLEREARQEKARLEREAEKERKRLEKERLEAEAKAQKLREQFEHDENKLQQDLEQEIQRCIEDLEAYVTKKRLAQEQEAKLAKMMAEAVIERERMEKERAEQERIAKEMAEQAERERLERERAEQAERERIAKEMAAQAERERLEKERAAQAEQERLEKERAEQVDRERLEKERAEQAEKIRLAEEKRKEKAKRVSTTAEERAALERAMQVQKERIARANALAAEKAAEEKAQASESAPAEAPAAVTPAMPQKIVVPTQESLPDNGIGEDAKTAAEVAAEATKAAAEALAKAAEAVAAAAIMTEEAVEAANANAAEENAETGKPNT